MNSFFRSATVSYKTTIVGVLVFAGVLSSNLAFFLDAKPETIADWNAVAIAAATMFGLLFAKDADKKSEDHEPIRTLKSNL